MDTTRPWNENKSKPFSVTLWGSNPNDENDDCWTGDDFATFAEAERIYKNPALHFSASSLRDTAFIMLDGPGPDLLDQFIRANPSYKPSRNDDSDWQQEYAMQAGMMGGCDAYNDAMGY